VADRIVGTISLDIQASEQEMIEATLPLVTQIERDQELAAARAVAEAVSANGLGAAGAAAVLRALQSGQVATLVIADDFSKMGWADYERNIYGVGPVPEVHPLGGKPLDMVPVALEDELVRLAISTGAEIEFIHSRVPFDDTDENVIPEPGTPASRTEAAAVLDELGGVGVLLRFALESPA
jgi:peptide subunit release factor 1 (eRF1)